MLMLSGWLIMSLPLSPSLMYLELAEGHPKSMDCLHIKMVRGLVQYQKVWAEGKKEKQYSLAPTQCRYVVSSSHATQIVSIQQST